MGYQPLLEVLCLMAARCAINLLGVLCLMAARWDISLCLECNLVPVDGQTPVSNGTVGH